MRSIAGIQALVLGAVIFCLCPVESAHPAEWIPLSGAVHVHTSEFSTGSHTLSELIDMAREREVDVIVLNDHDQIAMSYGLPPFRNLFALTFSRNSVLKQGARNYLEAVDRADKETSDVLLIPGLESAPFYYWTGSLREGSLTAHDFRKHLHVVGLTDPDDIEGLPLLQNGFSVRYFFPLFPRFLLFIGVLLLSLVMIKWGGIYRIVGKVLLILSILGAFDAHPFKSSRFDSYHDDPGVAPYQELIDYVESRGGMVFWAHPEANYGASEVIFDKTIRGVSLPKVQMLNGKYPADLIHTTGYTGFESLYGDTIHATEPGKEWDRVLTQYCDGKRNRPAWGLCGLDFHEERENTWSQLDRGQTVFWVKEKTRDAVLDAMRNGRMYAVFQGGAAKMRLETFTLSPKSGGEETLSGGTIESRGEPVRVRLKVSMSDGTSVPVKVDVIDSGTVLFTHEGETPFEISRTLLPSRAKGYVRSMVKAKQYQIVTNPIFYESE